ncbi:MAG TPA: hypothetical protein V6D06_21110 [Trichocoleus sp.]
MFQLPKSDAAASSVSPAPISSDSPLSREDVRLLCLGSVRGVLHTIKLLHVHGFAEPNDWSDLLPTGRPHVWMAILTKRLMIESGR